MIRDIAHHARVSCWYRARRLTRTRRNQRAQAAFEDAVNALRRGDVCLDCGANVGAITVRLAMTGAQVHAFEPDPDAFAQLATRCAEFPNVTLHNAAVGVGTGTVRLYRSAQAGANALSKTQRSSTVRSKANVFEHNAVDVEKRDFAQYLHSLNTPVSFVKMDIEGAEVEILEALFATSDHRLIRQMFVETHEKQIPALRSRTMALIRDGKRFGNVNFDWW